VRQTLELAPQLAMRPSPALLAFVQLLMLQAPELEQVVEQELSRNPALERVDAPAAGTPAAGSIAVEAVADVPSGRERLLAEAALTLPDADRPVAEYVVDSLDGRGFLDADVTDLARALGVDPVRVERVMSALRDAGPPGIAARNLRECLLVQLDRCGDGPVVALARRVVAEQLEAFAAGRDAAVAAALSVERPDVEKVRGLVRSLRPPVGLDADAGAPPVVVDIVVTERPDEPGIYDVGLPEAERLGLGLSPLYEQLAHDGAVLTDEERACVVAQVAQARAFIERLGRRSWTLHRVAEFVVARQRSFLRNGPVGLVPLTRADVAHALGLHESTVSRVVAGRYVQLPSGRLVPFADFFQSSLAVRDALARLVTEEDRPRSDAELARALAACGFTVARRTVAKYRERLGILPYALR
jgi:RNA polymerase sigma-54 factor